MAVECWEAFKVERIDLGSKLSLISRIKLSEIMNGSCGRDLSKNKHRIKKENNKMVYIKFQLLLWVPQEKEK